MGTFLNSVSPVLGNGETVSAVTLSNSVVLGSKVTDANGYEYIYVYNGGNSQISQGQAAVISGLSGYTVTVSSTTGADLPIGVARNATINTAAYGWLMYRGFSGFQAAANDSFVTGNILAIADQGNFANKTQATGAFGANVVGKAILSVASGAVTFVNAAWFNFM